MGGGEPDAAERTERGGVGVGLGAMAGERGGEETGDDANGFGGDDIVAEVEAMWRRRWLSG